MQSVAVKPRYYVIYTLLVNLSASSSTQRPPEAQTATRPSFALVYLSPKAKQHYLRECQWASVVARVEF